MKIIRADATEFPDFFHELRRRGGAFTPELLENVAQIIQTLPCAAMKRCFIIRKI